ncbi:MAG: antibiotic biosynthesis monooxygenase [Acidimicrobiaceae bacterium]|nr:antibiotic biosynthesis monooxygenase [Acidimicrobiaceae bacterium]
MITRVFSSDVVPGGLDGLARWLQDNAWSPDSTSASRIVGKDGSLGGALYRPLDPSERKIYIATHWADEASIAAHVGADWNNRGVSNPEESQYFSGPKQFRHYVLVNGTDGWGSGPGE